MGMGVVGVNLSNKRFGKLVAIEKEKMIDGKYKWRCICDCGNVHYVNTYHLTHGDIKSCGCSHFTACVTHGKTNTRIYHIWCTMKARCNRETAQKYARYGGRGIKLCREWNEFEAFYKWAMANGYSDDLSIERIDNNGDYSPKNCKWATAGEQANNTSKSRKIEAFGEIHTIAEWGRIKGVNSAVIWKRLKRGWNPEDAIRIPVGLIQGGVGLGYHQMQKERACNTGR